MKRKYIIITIILILFFFPEFDNYSQQYWNKSEQWQFGGLHYFIREDCWEGIMPSPKYEVMFRSFLIGTGVKWGTCEEDIGINSGWNPEGFYFSVRDRLHPGYDIFYIGLNTEYGAIGIFDKYIDFLSLW